MSKIILKLDASALKKSACRRKLFRTVVQGYTFKRSTNIMDYGTSFHKFKEELTKTKNKHIAISLAQDKWKELEAAGHEIGYKKEYLGPEHLTKTCLEYLSQFGERRERDDFQSLVVGEKELVELKFALPYRSTPKIDVLLAGTIDDIGKFKRGCYAFGDEKTSGTWQPSEYFTTYELSTQLMFYRLAVSKMAEMKPDSIYGEIEQSGKVGAFINGVFYTKDKPTQFVRSKVFFFPHDLRQEFSQLLTEVVDKLLYDAECWLADPTYVPIREGIINESCIDKYGKPCEFFHECAAPDDISRSMILKNHFRQRDYNPLEFGGGSKE